MSLCVNTICYFADWVEVLDYQITALADTVRGDLTYFSNKFIECGFITQTAANDILSKLGVSNGDKARELLHLVRQNYNISLKKQLWSEKFISIFSSQAAYHDLAMLLKGTSISEGNSTSSCIVIQQMHTWTAGQDST